MSLTYLICTGCFMLQDSLQKTPLYSSLQPGSGCWLSVVLRSEVTFQDGDKLGVLICTAPVSYGGVFEQ